ncbi:phage tail family protein [Streptomyces nodosus]|uniref:phage tail protein n=1 Tax=Streptomyces nodosus TaxID=40318 RepID=UPI003820BBD2
MPLITAPVVTPPDPGTPGGGKPIPLPGIGEAIASYTDPTGTVWPLSSPAAGWFTLPDGVSGLGAATYALTKDEQPRGGARLRNARAQARTIVWPLYVYGRDHMEFVERWRALAAAFTRTLQEGADGRLTPGVLTIARPDGTSRRVRVFYEAGFEGRGQRGSGLVSDAAALVLWCEDPYWEDSAAIPVHREAGSMVDFLNPYPAVSSSQVIGATTLDNPGDLDVWPEWRITGPASAITFTRGDTGRSFTLTMSETPHGPLLEGELVTISTHPPRIRSGTGENLISGLNWPGAVLWSIPPGKTPVTFQLDGSGPGSAVDLEFHPRYQTA